MAPPHIDGACDDRFTAVADAFASNFDEHDDLGASVAVTLDGEPVVDLWGGDADLDGRPWTRDTIVNVWSTTKTMTAICVLMLIDRGLVDPDDPVAVHWPGFEVNGKEGVLVRHVLSHTAGLSGFDPPVGAGDQYDWQLIADRLAAQAPWWEPGTAVGYHAVTQGFLLGEVVRRVDGRSVGTFFAEEVAGPLGADFHIGLPRTEHHRVAQLVAPADMRGAALAAAKDDRDSIAWRTATSVPRPAEEIAAANTEAWREAEIPASGGTGNARAVARVHSALANGGSVDGVRLMSAATVESILEPQFEGVDLVLGMPFRQGLGFGLVSESQPLSPNERAFWWGGWGGSMAVVDLDARASIAYTMNRMRDGMDVRAANVVFAAYRCL